MPKRFCARVVNAVRNAVAPVEGAETERQPTFPKTSTIPGGMKIAPPVPVSNPGGITRPIGFPKTQTLRTNALTPQDLVEVPDGPMNVPIS